MLTRGDDYPLHQTADPIATAGTDRNFYDRYFFNGYSDRPDDARMFAVAFGIYPHLDIVDAHVCWLHDGRQVNLHASARADGERLLLRAGPIAVEIVEPLRTLRVTVDAPDHGIRADLTFTARAAPIEEPRFTRRIGTRTLLDYTRLTQNGRYTGSIEVDGVAHDLAGFVGTRDRSWGVRPIGARDPQPPPAPPQFFWLWSPCVFPDRDFYWHTNDDAHGRPWNRRAVVMPVGGAAEDETIGDATATLTWRPATRAAATASLALALAPTTADAPPAPRTTAAPLPGEGRGPVGASQTIEDRTPTPAASGPPPTRETLTFTPVTDFMMLGLGYGHPRWAHGLDHGPLAVEREDFAPAELDRTQPHHFHVQTLADVRWTIPDGTCRTGRGVLEQLAIGPHAPSGFTALTDVAP